MTYEMDVGKLEAVMLRERGNWVYVLDKMEVEFDSFREGGNASKGSEFFVDVDVCLSLRSRPSGAEVSETWL